MLFSLALFNTCMCGSPYKWPYWVATAVQWAKCVQKKGFVDPQRSSEASCSVSSSLTCCTLDKQQQLSDCPWAQTTMHSKETPNSSWWLGTYIIHMIVALLVLGVLQYIAAVCSLAATNAWMTDTLFQIKHYSKTWRDTKQTREVLYQGSVMMMLDFMCSTMHKPVSLYVNIKVVVSL